MVFKQLVKSNLLHIVMRTHRVKGLFFKLCFLQKTSNYIGMKLHRSMNPERPHVLLLSASATTQSCGLRFPNTLNIACQGQTVCSEEIKYR